MCDEQFRIVMNKNRMTRMQYHDASVIDSSLVSQEALLLPWSLFHLRRYSEEEQKRGFGSCVKRDDKLQMLPIQYQRSDNKSIRYIC